MRVGKIETGSGIPIPFPLVDVGKAWSVLSNPNLFKGPEVSAKEGRAIVDEYKRQYRDYKNKGGTRSYGSWIKWKGYGAGLDIHKAIGKLSGLASVGVNKLFGRGFLIPDSKVNQLIQYKDLLTEKQKRDILNALQTGSGVHIKPTKKQMGTGIGTILASIGIPMLLDAIMGKGLQVDSNRSRRSVPIKLPPLPPPHLQGGKMYHQYPYQTPPFYGTWDQMGMGKGGGKKKTWSGFVNGSSRSKSGYGFQQKRLVKNPSVRSTNIKFIDKPLSNFDLINWVNQLGIKHFRGVFSRDDLPSEINEPEVGIINLDSKIGPGTHWVCYRNDDKDLCEYFDSFGLLMPNDVLKYLQTSGEKIIYSTDEIQERDSVLCGYWCLYYLLERQNGRSIIQILHNTAFDPNDKSKFIIRYFK